MTAPQRPGAPGLDQPLTLLDAYHLLGKVAGEFAARGDVPVSAFCAYLGVADDGAGGDPAALDDVRRLAAGMVSARPRKEEVFVILRADRFHGPDTELKTLVTAKQVVFSRDMAEREVARLNALHPDGTVRYWAAMSRLFPFGTSAGGPLDAG